MFNWLEKKGLNAKVASLGVGSVLIATIALLSLAVWQSGQYNQLAQSAVDGLIEADLDHITQGTYQLVQTENEAVQQQIDGNLRIARHVLAVAGSVDLSEETVAWTAVNQFTGEPVSVQLPRMRVGGRWLGQNTDPAVETPVVDEVTRVVGETTALFQRMNDRGDMLRVATTVRDAEGRRAIGTFIPAVNPDGTPNPVIAAVLQGETYHGRTYVVNAWHLAAYEAIKDSNGDLIGMLYTGIRQSAIESRVRKSILRTQVGKTGYVYVLSGKGEDRGRYIISQKGERDGENIWESKDSDGQYMVQAIIGQAMVLKPGELATVRYRWQNPGDPVPRWKIARLAYYTPWDWVIGTSVYEDELQSYRAFLTHGRMQMTRTMCLAGLAITLLIGLVGVLVAWTITRPLQQMTKAVETIIQGNLSQTLDIHSHDELGVLAEAFNVMIRKLGSTVEGFRQSEEKYRYIFENSIEGIFQTTLDGRFLTASPAMARMLGHDSPEELMATLSRQLYVRPEEREALLAQLMESRCPIERELQWYRKDRQPIWVSLNVQAMRDGEGQLLCLQGFVTDITKRRRAEELVRADEARLRSILAATPTGVTLLKDRVFLQVNKTCCDTLGYSESELVGSESRLLYADDTEFERVGRELYLRMGREGFASMESRLRRKDGAIIDVLMCMAPFDSKNIEAGAAVTIQDITDRKRAEEAMRRNADRIRQQNAAITQFATDEVLAAGDLRRVFAMITEAAARAVDVARVSIWRLVKNGEAFSCVDTTRPASANTRRAWSSSRWTTRPTSTPCAPRAGSTRVTPRPTRARGS